jgi:hypothetical protein
LPWQRLRFRRIGVPARKVVTSQRDRSATGCRHTYRYGNGNMAA